MQFKYTSLSGLSGLHNTRDGSVAVVPRRLDHAVHVHGSWPTAHRVPPVISSASNATMMNTSTTPPAILKHRSRCVSPCWQFADVVSLGRSNLGRSVASAEGGPPGRYGDERAHEIGVSQLLVYMLCTETGQLSVMLSGLLNVDVGWCEHNLF